MQTTRKLMSVLALTAGLLSAESGRAASIFTDDLESGTLANWTTTASSPLTIATGTNRIPVVGGNYSALLDSSLDRMHRNIIGDNGGSEISGHVVFSYWFYDDGVAGLRFFTEIRGYTGGTGLPNGGATASGSLAQLLAFGKYNSVTLPGDTAYNGTKYQARAGFTTNATIYWFNLDGAGSANRSIGWHKFTMERDAGGSTVRFYVDGILSRTINDVVNESLDTVVLGLGAGAVVGNGWMDGFEISSGAPTVTSNPAPATVVAGNSVTFRVADIGGITYQWTHAGTNIPGATNSSLTLNNVQAENAGQYAAIVGNSAGDTPSGEATLGVTPAPPAITSQPVNTTNCAGSTASFTVAATGEAPLTYQWYFEGNTVLTDATNATAYVSNVAPANVGGYTVVISNIGGMTTSAVAQLVLAVPTTATGPTNLSVCPGGLVSFTTVAAGEGPFSYVWRKDGGAALASTSNTLEIASVTVADAGVYSVEVTGACNSVTNSATLTVAPGITSAVGPDNTNKCAGTTLTLATVASGTGPFTYVWRKDGGDPLGSTSNTLTISPVVIGDAGNYSVEVSGPCGSVTNTAAVTVSPAPNVAVNSAIICTGGSAVLTATTDAASPTYLWSPGGQTTQSVTNSPTSTTTYTVTVTDGTTLCSAQGSGTITVRTNTTITAIGNKTNCPSSTVVLTTTASGTGPFSYVWRKNGGAPLGETTATLTLNGVTTTDSGTYSVEVTGACNTATNSAFVRIIPAPGITSQPTSRAVPMRNGTVFSVTGATTNSVLAPLSYQWKTNGVDVLNATNSTFAISNLTLAMNGMPVSVAVSSCGGTTLSSAATLTVTPIAGISFDFDTPGQFTNAPYNNVDNDWQLGGSGLQGAFVTTQPFGPVLPFEMPTGGVQTAISGPIGGGSLDLAFNQAPDQSFILTPLSYDFSLPNTVLQASIMVKIKVPTAAARAIHMGFITATNGDDTLGNRRQLAGVNGTANMSFMSAILQSEVINSVTPGYRLRAQWRNNALGTVPENIPVNTPTNALATNRWYKFTAVFSNTTAIFGTNSMTISATLQDMGPFGTNTAGAIVLGMAPQTTNTAALATSNRWYFAIRTAAETGGNDYWDNVYVTTQPGALQVISPVQSPTVNQGQRARLTALVDGDGPYTYQWYKNGVAIPGAGNWKYATEPLGPADNGAEYSVTVTGPASSVSSTGVVTVAAQDLAVLSVGSVEGSVIGLRFSQPVNGTATNPANYTVNGVAAFAAQIVANGGIQQWRTNEVLITPATPVSGSFTVAVANVESSFGTLIGSQNTAVGEVIGLVGTDIDPQAAGILIQTPTLPGWEYSFAPGQVTVNAGGHDIGALYDGFRFTYKQITGDFDLKVRIPYNEAVRITSKAGFDARVSLDPASPNVGTYADPTSPGRNLFYGTWRTNYNQATGLWGQEPANFYPNAWLRFRRVGSTFIRHSSSNGVNWICDGQIQITGNAAEFPETLYVGLANNANVGQNTAQQYKMSQMDNFGSFAYAIASIANISGPSNITVAAGNAATFTNTATLSINGVLQTAAGELVYQWQRTNTASGGWTNMPGMGTNAVLNTGTLWASDNGAMFRVILKASGAASVTSSVAVLTVTDGAAASIVASATVAAPQSPNQLVLAFNELLDAATALDAANYVVTNGLGVQVNVIGVSFLGHDRSRVVLTVDGTLPGGTNFVRVTNLRDLNNNLTPSTLVALVMSSTATPTMQAYQQQGPVVIEWWHGLISAGGTRELVNDVRYRRNLNNTEAWNGPNGSFDSITYSNVFGIHPTAALPSNGYGENYGAKVYSYFRPAVSGAYRFYIRGDDFAELWMNTNTVNSTLPADVVIGTGTTQTNSPVGEQAWFAMDGVTTNANFRWGSKYLNSSGLNSGLYVVPAIGDTTVGGIRFWAANDAVQRDPLTYRLAGSTNAGTNGPWVTIAVGDTGLSGITNLPGLGRYFPTNVMFTNLAGVSTNVTPYRSYQLIFPTVRNQPSADNVMQIGEVQFLDAAGTKIVPSGATLLSVLNVNNATYNITNSSSNVVFNAGIQLNAGQLYYIETRFHEGGGGDGVAVAARMDGTIPAATEVISNNFLVFPTNMAPLTPVQWEQYSGLPTLNPVSGLWGWTGAAGNGAVQDTIYATNLSNFIARIPNISGYAQYFGWNSNRFQSGATMEGYLSRMYCYFVPPTNGAYRFWAQVDDTMQLYMNTNAVDSTDPAGIKLLGQIINYGGTTAVNSNGIINIGGNSGAYTLIVTNLNLVGGQRYFMEARWREGTGGDGVNVAVRAQGDTATPGVAETIPLSMLEFATNVTQLRYGPIGMQGMLTTLDNGAQTTASSITVNEGDVLQLQPVGMYGAGSMQGALANGSITTGPGTTEAQNLATMGMIWMKNGTDLFKNTVFVGQMYYRTQPITYADNGGTISLLVTNTFSTYTQTVTLTVNQDTTAPTIAFANGSQYGDTVTLLFSENVDSLTAQCLANYSIPGLQIYWAKRDDVNRKRVVLGTSRHTPLQVYTVTANGVRDIAGNPSSGATKDFTAWGTGGIGGVYVEIFTNMNGAIDQFLQASPKWIYNMPDVTYYTNNFGIGQAGFTADTGLNFYGARISALFNPPSNGLYRFYVRADDASQLYMNTNGPDARGIVMIARNDQANSTTNIAANLSGYQTGPGIGGDSSKIGASISPVISLTNGTPYWMEAIFKEGTGGDYLEVVMRAVDPNTGLDTVALPFVPAAGNMMAGGFFSAPGNPDVNKFIVNSAPPSEITTNENDFVVLALDATLVPPSLQPFVQVRWQISNALSGGVFTNIPGATTLSYSFFADLANDGAIYRLVANIPGSTVIYDTLLHVITDVEPPYIITTSSLDGYTIGVRFNEPVSLSTGDEPSNYQVNSGDVAVVAARVRTNTDPRTVVLTLDSPISGEFLLDVFAMSDRAVTPNDGSSFATGSVQGFIGMDIGATPPLAVGSSYSDTNGIIEVIAGGLDIWNASDQGHITVGQRSGDFDVWTRVDSLLRTSADTITKAGLVIRETTNADSRALTFLMNPPAALGGRDLMEVGYRTNVAQNTGPWPFGPNFTPAGIPNAWVRLKREGNFFSAFRSTDGVNWTLHGTNGAVFPRTVWVGLGSTAHNNAAPPTLAVYKDYHFPNPPTILTQPSPASQSIALHGSTSYTVVASNPPNAGTLTYRWRRDGMVVVSTTDTLTISDARGVDSGVYTVEVGNDGGTVFSDAVTLIVNNGLPVNGTDSLSATQGIGATIPIATLLGNDSDPEGSNLTFLAVSGFTPVTVETNFAQGNLTNATLYGTHQPQALTGVLEDGYLVLTKNNTVTSQAGSMVINDFTGGKRVGGFSASFKLLIGDASGQPADGFSFNFANNLQDTANTGLGENGVGTGFSFCVDNYQFAPYPGGGTAFTSGMKIRYNNANIAGVQIAGAWNQLRFVPVIITLANNGALTVNVDGTNAFNLMLPAPLNTAGRFGFYARTGGEREATFIDDVSITALTSETPNGGTVGISGANVTYNAGTNCGADSFYYVTQDSEVNGFGLGTVNVTVAPAAPVISTCASNITLTAGVGCQGTIPDLTSGSGLAYSSCGGATVTQSPAAGTVVPLGPTVVTITVSNVTGVATCQATVNVVDNQGPNVTCPGNIVAEATSAAGRVVMFTPTAVDNCDGSPVIVSSPASGSTFPIGITTVTVSASDASGNTNTCTFTVTVRDTTAPTIDCPTNVTVQCSGTNATATYSATATDLVDSNPTVLLDPPSGSSFPVGTNTVTVTAYDAAGNTNTCTFLVIVEDPIEAELTITRSLSNVTICWPQSCTPYVLESTLSLDPVVVWTTVTNVPDLTGTNFCVTLPGDQTKKFFRLQKQ